MSTFITFNEELLLENLSNLVKAVLDVDPGYEFNEDHEEYGNMEWDFISALNSVKSLYLYGDTTLVKHVFHVLLLNG